MLPAATLWCVDTKCPAIDENLLSLALTNYCIPINSISITTSIIENSQFYHVPFHNVVKFQ